MGDPQTRKQGDGNQCLGVVEDAIVAWAARARAGVEHASVTACHPRNGQPMYTDVRPCVARSSPTGVNECLSKILLSVFHLMMT